MPGESEKPGPLSGYCEYAASPGADPLHVDYHDREYGFAVHSDDALFERLMLEINQAGLSWTTILRKRSGFEKAYCGFSVEKVAAFTEDDVARILSDAGVIRNRLKVRAAIHNAQVVQGLQATHGSFSAWLDSFGSLSLGEWMKVFRKTFTFTGREVVNEFLVSTGYLPGAHGAGCPAYARSVASNPPWSSKRQV